MLAIAAPIFVNTILVRITQPASLTILFPKDTNASAIATLPQVQIHFPNHEFVIK